jgi:pimeloyl-ACP methyl ester carboxylesterase
MSQRGVAMVRYGEHRLSKDEVLALFSDDIDLIVDVAILSSEVYYRCSGKALPKSLPGKKYAWERLDDPAVKQPISRRRGIFLGGLYLEVWHTTDATGKAVAAIVFRGTRFTSWRDWYANLRWFTKWIPGVLDQYHEASARAAALLQLIRARSTDEVRVITAGHSLGGGLAQQVAYSSPGVTDVFAFNPSPVTGFYSVAEKVRNECAQKLRIMRIYEHQEVLAYFRDVLRPFYPLTYNSPSIREVGFRFTKGDALVKHGIEKFARGLHALRHVT